MVNGMFILEWQGCQYCCEHSQLEANYKRTWFHHEFGSVMAITESGYIQDAAHHQIRQHSGFFEDYFLEHFENISMVNCLGNRAFSRKFSWIDS